MPEHIGIEMPRTSTGADVATGLISVVVPVYNEEEVVSVLHRRLSAVLATFSFRAEIVYVNDGSRDDTLAVLRDLQRSDPNMVILDLSRNYGKDIALTAGLDYALGDAVVVIDADLQDPPELIPELVAQWKQGADVVYAKRISRSGESFLKLATAFLFYRVIQRIGRVKMPEDTGDFRLLSRRALEAVKTLRERHRFMKGLFTWVGFNQVAVPYQRAPRLAGVTKWNYWRLWNFALEGITSFTTSPLKVSTYVGFLTAMGAFVYGLVIIGKTLLLGRDLPGYPSLMVVILFLGGVQLLAIGVMGEYIGRTFDEAKNRPLYFLKDVYRR